MPNEGDELSDEELEIVVGGSKNIKIFTGSENNINYIIIPTKRVKSLKRRKTPNTWGRYRVNIGHLPSYKKYENDLGWSLIKKFLKIRG